MFFENCRHTFVENAMILRKVLFFEVGAPESSFLGLKAAWLLDQHIVWILNNARFNNWFKDQRDGKISSF